MEMTKQEFLEKLDIILKDNWDKRSMDTATESYFWLMLENMANKQFNAAFKRDNL